MTAPSEQENSVPSVFSVVKKPVTCSLRELYPRCSPLPYQGSGYSADTRKQSQDRESAGDPSGRPYDSRGEENCIRADHHSSKKKDCALAVPKSCISAASRPASERSASAATGAQSPGLRISLMKARSSSASVKSSSTFSKRFSTLLKRRVCSVRI